MRVFLAGRFSRRDEFSAYAGELRSLGITVDARWLEPDRHGVTDDEVMIELADMMDADADAPVAALIAVEALEDLRNADVLVAFTEPPRSTNSRGGHHVEFGMALAWKKWMLLVGPRENVFHAMVGIEQVGSWGPEALKVLTEWKSDLEGADDAAQ